MHSTVDIGVALVANDLELDASRTGGKQPDAEEFVDARALHPSRDHACRVGAVH